MWPLSYRSCLLTKILFSWFFFSKFYPRLSLEACFYSVTADYKCLFLFYRIFSRVPCCLLVFFLLPYPWMLWPANITSSAPSDASIEPKVAIIVSAPLRSCTVSLSTFKCLIFSLLDSILKTFCQGPIPSVFSVFLKC